MLHVMAKKSYKSARPPRILVPNKERALFTVDAKKMVGVIRRLSLTGGSAVLSGGPISEGTLAEMDLSTVSGKVSAQIQFMHTGADGTPTAQAFRFIDMDGVSSKRFSAAVKQMEKAGFSDVEGKENAFGNLTSLTLGKLRDSLRTLSGAIAPSSTSKS
jgi:hypothetical protein